MKHIALIFTITCLLILFSSCMTAKLVEKQTIIYETGFPLNEEILGRYYDKSNKKEYIYLGTVTTKKNSICFFNINGDMEFNIPLHIEYKHLLWIHSVLVYNLDTIIMIDRTWRNPQIAYFNRKGECVRVINCDSVFNTGTDKYIFFAENQNISNQYLYIKYFWNWQYPGDRTSFPKQFPNQLEYHRAYLKKFHTYPQLAKLNIQTNELTVYPTNFTRTYLETDTTLFLSGGLNVICAKNNLLLYNHLYNEILVINQQSMKLEQKVKIASEYSEIGIKLRTAEEDYIQSYQMYEDNLAGRIWNILFDEKNNLYYLIIQHSPSKDDRWTNDYIEERNFSIIIYDKQFNKLNEQFFDKDKYDYKYIILCSKGLLIAHSTNKKDYDPTKCKFTLYEIEK